MAGWLAAGMAALAMPGSAQVPDIGPSHCVANCGGGGSSGGDRDFSGLGRAIHDFLYGSDDEIPSEPAYMAQARALNAEGLALSAAKDWWAGRKKFLQAYAVDANGAYRANATEMESFIAYEAGDLPRALAQARAAATQFEAAGFTAWLARVEAETADRAARERSAAQVGQSVNALVASLGGQGSSNPSAGNGSAGKQNGLDFMSGSPGGAPPPKPPPPNVPPSAAARRPNLDGAVVDLSDATTDSVDPRRVKGGASRPPRDQGLQFMTALDQTKVPTPDEQARELASQQRLQAADRRYRDSEQRWARAVRDTVFRERLHRALVPDGATAADKIRAQLLYDYVIKPKAEADFAKDFRRWKEMTALMKAAEQDTPLDSGATAVIDAAYAELLRRGVMMAQLRSKSVTLPEPRDLDLLFGRAPGTPAAPRDSDLLFETVGKSPREMAEIYASRRAAFARVDDRLMSIFEPRPDWVDEQEPPRQAGN